MGDIVVILLVAVDPGVIVVILLVVVDSTEIKLTNYKLNIHFNPNQSRIKI